MGNKNGKVNLQIWIPKSFKLQIEKVAADNGYARWQTFCEIVITRAVAGDIELKPPQLIEAKKRRK